MTTVDKMKNKMFVRKAALLLSVGGLLASGTALVSSVANASVSATAVTNGPIYYPTNTGLAAVNPDGTSATKPSFLTGNAPTYSADGTLVTWTESGASGDTLMVSNADGTNKVAVMTTSNNDRLANLAFSSDKSRIYFLNKTSGGMYGTVFTIASDGSENTPIALTPSLTSVSSFSLSSTGEIAYIASACGGTTGVYIRDTSGTSSLISNTCTTAGSTQKTSNAVIWKSDGSKLFLSMTDFATNTNSLLGLTVNGSTGTTTPITTATNRIGGITHSPDNTRIAFMSSDFQNNSVIKTVNEDGTNEVTVLSFIGSGHFSWGIPVAQSGGGDNNSTPDSGSDNSSGSGSSTGGSTNTPSNNTTTNNVVPGVTVTDTKIYTKAPKQVAADSAVAVMTREEAKTQTIASNTPDVCLPNKDDIVFIDKGRCSASILDKKTGEVLRRFRTTVVEDEVPELKIGNEVAILAPIYFDGGSTDVNAKGMRRIRRIQDKITAAGSVLVVGHSGIALGDTEANRILSKERARSTVAAMKKVGAKGPFFATGVGGADPLTTSTSGKDQGKNRRVVIILVP